jgi:hypothetical protein
MRRHCATFPVTATKSGRLEKSTGVSASSQSSISKSSGTNAATVVIARSAIQMIGRSSKAPVA